jgi:Ca-activated chloride channel family protein
LQFQYPEAFWLLLLIPAFILLFFYYTNWKRKAFKRIGDEKLVKKLFSGYSPVKSLIKFCLLLIAFILGCIALANPRKPDESSVEARKGIDVVLALDISNSMLATDLPPSRLIRAKQFMNKLIDNITNNRVGLVVFAGNAYIQMPLTFDFDAAKMFISTAAPGQVQAQGTSIADALKKSDLLFNGVTERFRSIVLITDGETHDDNALQTAGELSKKGIMINTVGIGSVEGSTIIDSAGSAKRDASGQIIVTKLNEQLLQQIATATNGKYAHLDNTDASVQEVLAQYTNIEKKALGDVSLFSYETFYYWMALPMLLILILEIFVPDRKMVNS